MQNVAIESSSALVSMELGPIRLSFGLLPANLSCSVVQGTLYVFDADDPPLLPPELSAYYQSKTLSFIAEHYNMINCIISFFMRCIFNNSNKKVAYIGLSKLLIHASNRLRPIVQRN